MSKPVAVAKTAKAPVGKAPAKAPAKPVGKASAKLVSKAPAPAPAPPAEALVEDTPTDEVLSEDDQRLRIHFKDLGEISQAQRALLLEYLDMYYKYPGHEAVYSTPRVVWGDSNHPMYAPWMAYMSKLDMESAAHMLSVTYKCQSSTCYSIVLASWMARQLEGVERYAELVELVRQRRV